MRVRKFRSRAASGFSLSELLVVLGIVGLLVALLMPAVSAARARANELACRAKLREIGLAAEMHANAHRNHLPACGYHWQPDGGVVNPRGLGDPDERKFLYYDDNGEKRPAPVTVALAVAMGAPVRLESRDALEQDMEADVVRKYFRCPSQGEQPEGISQIAEDGWQSPAEYSSYIFNEALMGRRERGKYPGPPTGHRARVKRPAEVLLAMDGLPRDQKADRLLAVYEYGPDETLADFAPRTLPSGNSGGDALDFARHRFRANVLYLDGHVAAVLLTSDGMRQVGISQGFN